MLPPEWQNVRRILAVRLDNIGDMVMLSPALRTLHKALPIASITLMTSQAGKQVAPLLPWIQDVLLWRAVWQDASGAMALDPEREQNLIAQLRDQQFDAAVIFTSFSQSPYPPAYVAYLAGIPLRIAQSREFGGSVLSHWVKPLPDPTYQVDRNLHLLEATGFPVAERHLELAISADVQAASDRRLKSAGIDPQKPFIVLAPGASCAARRYDMDRFAIVSQLLTKATHLPIAVVGTEREKDLLAPILKLTQSSSLITSLVGQTSVPELAAVIRRASLVIANNSGSMHFAEAFERPMVILFSGTDFESQWQPRYALTRLLRYSTNCSPCYQFQCPYQMECLDIPPMKVVNYCLGVLQSELGMHFQPLSLSVV